jgi:hypothetical protein
MAAAGERDENSWKEIAAHYVAGAEVPWNQILRGRCVAVPTYPWQQQRLWANVDGCFAALPHGASTAGNGTPIVHDPHASDGNGRARSAPREHMQPRPEMTTPYVAPESPLERDLAASWSEILHVDRVGVHDAFFELGGDSLQATMLLNRLRTRIGEKIQASVLFENQTVSDWATYLRTEHAEAVRRRYPTERVCDAIHPDYPRVVHGAADSPILRTSQDGPAERLVATVDQLSDDEVTELLRTTLLGRKTADD